MFMVCDDAAHSPVTATECRSNVPGGCSRVLPAVGCDTIGQGWLFWQLFGRPHDSPAWASSTSVKTTRPNQSGEDALYAIPASALAFLLDGGADLG